ncbi:MAG: hypothetical protein ACXACW_10950, partial [Candidatus Hodarchaeales archaeon]
VFLAFRGGKRGSLILVMITANHFSPHLSLSPSRFHDYPLLPKLRSTVLFDDTGINQSRCEVTY